MPSRSSRPWLRAASTPSKCSRTVCKRSVELAVGEKIDLLFGKIDRRLDVGAQIDHRLGEPAHHGGELPLQRAHRRARRLARAGVDEVRDGLGLRQIELVVEEGALRELAGLRAPRAELERALRSAPPAPPGRRGPAARARARRCRSAAPGKNSTSPASSGSCSRIEKAREGRAARGGQLAERRGRRSPATFGPERRTMPMPPRPGGVAAATMVSVRVMTHRAGQAASAAFLRAAAAALDAAVDVPLLRRSRAWCWSPSTAPGPRGRTRTCTDITSGMIMNTFACTGSGGAGFSLYCTNIATAMMTGRMNSGSREDRSWIQQHERRLAHLHALEQHPVEGEEHRDLDDDRQAAGDRIDLLALVELHHRAAELLAIVLVGLLQVLDARLRASSSSPSSGRSPPTADRTAASGGT